MNRARLRHILASEGFTKVQIRPWGAKADVDYPVTQEILNEFPLASGVGKIPRDLRKQIRLVHPDFEREVGADLISGKLKLPPGMLKASTSRHTLTLYRGTSFSEWEEAMAGEITHPAKYDMFKQFGGFVKYLTDDVEYAQAGRWGGNVIAYTFSGTLLGPIKGGSYDFQNIVSKYVFGLIQAGKFWTTHASLCDGMYGPERGVRKYMTYGIHDLATLTVDRKKTEALVSTSRDPFI